MDERYLIESYEMACEALDGYAREYDIDNLIAARSSLLKAAAILCASLTNLGSDSEFWNMLREFMNNANAHRFEVNRHLDDLGAFLQLERDIFEKAGLCRGRIVGLLAETESALREIARSGWADDLEFLRKQLNDVSAKMCNFSRGQFGGGWFDPAFFEVRRGLRVLGGGVTIATNWVSIPALGVLAYLSGIAGLSMIADSFDRRPRQRG